MMTEAKPREVKVTVMGDVGVGKSAIAMRFVTNNFKPYSESTIGSSFLSKMITYSGRPLKFQIMIAAGQEKYHSMAPMYYRGAAAVLLVYDITRVHTFRTVKMWVEELQIKGPKDVIISIVGNKSHLEDQREVDKAMVEKYAEEIGALFKEVSLKTDDDNMQDLFISIAHRLPSPSQPDYAVRATNSNMRNMREQRPQTSGSSMFSFLYNTKPTTNTTNTTAPPKKPAVSRVPHNKGDEDRKWQQLLKEDEPAQSTPSVVVPPPPVLTPKEKQAALLKKVLQETNEMTKVSWRRSRLLVVGPGGAGKTSFVRSLTDVRFHPDHVSTTVVAVSEVQGVDRGQVSVKSTVQDLGIEICETSSWCSKQHSDVEAVLRAEVAAGIFEKTPKQISHKKPTTMPPLSKALSPTEESSVSFLNTILPQIPNESLTAPLFSELVSDFESMKSLGDACLGSKLTQNLDNVKEGDQESVTFSIWDFGGQQMFQTVQHLFLTRNGVYSVVVDINTLLSGGSQVKDSCQILQIWFKLITLYALGAPVAIIMTHVDSLAASAIDHTYAHIDNLLRDALHDIPSFSNLIYNFGRCFWAVDNTISSDDADETILRLRYKLEEAAIVDPVEYVHFKLPVSWIELCDKLKALSARNIPYIPLTSDDAAGDTDNLYSLAVECGVISASPVASSSTANEIIASALHKLHELGVILYIENSAVLRKWVILSPQWLVDKIAHLIRDFQLHRLEGDSAAIQDCTVEWVELMNCGILHEALLPHIWGSDRETVDYMLNVMEALGLICGLPSVRSSARYFIPAAVLYSTSENDNTQAGDSAQADYRPWQLSIQFTNGTIPPGLVDRLLVSFVRQYNSLYVLGTRQLSPQITLSGLGTYTAQLLFSDTTADMTSFYIHFDSNAVEVYCDAYYIDSLNVAIGSAITDIVQEYLNCGERVSYEIQTSHEQHEVQPYDFQAHEYATELELVETHSASFQTTKKTKKSTFSWAEWLHTECGIDVENSALYAHMFTQSGYDSGESSVLMGVACRYHDDEKQFNSYLFELGIKSAVHRDSISAVIAQIDVEKGDRYSCIVFTTAEDSSTSMELKSIRASMKNYFVQRRTFSLVAILNELVDTYNVLHICTSLPKGAVNTRLRDSLSTVLREDDGSAEKFVSYIVPATSFVSCVFLNCSHSESLAILLCERGLQYAVCWTTEVDDVAAKAFAEEFYRTLNTRNDAYENAYQRAVNALVHRNIVICDPKDHDYVKRLRAEPGAHCIIPAGIPRLVCGAAIRKAKEDEAAAVEAIRQQEIRAMEEELRQQRQREEAEAAHAAAVQREKLAQEQHAVAERALQLQREEADRQRQLLALEVQRGVAAHAELLAAEAERSAVARQEEADRLAEQRQLEIRLNLAKIERRFDGVDTQLGIAIDQMSSFGIKLDGIERLCEISVSSLGSLIRGQTEYPNLFLILKCQPTSTYSLTKKLMLVFLCPIDRKLATYDGKPGYTFKTARGWVFKGLNAVSKFKEEYGWMLTLSAFAVKTALHLFAGVTVADIVPQECVDAATSAMQATDFLQTYIDTNCIANSQLGFVTDHLSETDTAVAKSAGVKEIIGVEYRKFAAFLRSRPDFDLQKLDMVSGQDVAGVAQWVATRNAHHLL